MFENLGVTIAWQASTIEGLDAIASEADKLGFGYFWVPEAWGLEGFSTVSHVFGKTSRIRVGTGITNIFSRSAALIGMGCATLDQMAPGRFVLGLGSSGKSLVENWHGFEFSKPLKRTREYVQVIRKVVSGENVEFHGDILKPLSKFRLFTKAMQSKLEIYLGAIGNANLRLAGEICDGAILAMYPSSRLDSTLKLLNVNGGTEKKLFTYLPTFVSTSEEELKKARQQVAKNIAFYVTSMGSYYVRNLIRSGYEDAVSEILRGYAHGSRTVVESVSEEMLSDLSLIGSPESIMERVSTFPNGVVPVMAFDIRSLKEAINSMRVLSTRSR